MSELVGIFANIILPILALVAAGFYLERRFKFHIETLTKLNFYVFVPALLFKSLIEAAINWADLAMVAVFQIALIFALLVANLGAVKVLKLGTGLSAAYLMATVFCNSGNFGIPLVSLAFPDVAAKAVSYQAVTVTVQNLSTFTLGLIIVGHGRASVRESLGGTLKLPFIYVIGAALLFKQFDVPVRDYVWVWKPIEFAGNGLVAIALVTLGVQVAKTPKLRHIRALISAVSMRLLLAPIVAFALVKLFGFTGMLAELLVIASAGPSAVNTVLISLEFKNEPDFAASAVFLSTMLSGVTVAVTILLVRHFM